VVAGVLTRRGAIFAARRAASRALGGYWELPGGKVEAGEADEEALVRELAEELGIEVSVGPRLAESVWDGGSRPIHLIAYFVTRESGDVEVRPSGVDHDAFRWLRREELFGVEWAPPDVPLIVALREHSAW
jgi:8-oxo-dGTP diphosphatase